jgi:hypothetical protein
VFVSKFRSGFKKQEITPFNYKEKYYKKVATKIDLNDDYFGVGGMFVTSGNLSPYSNGLIKRYSFEDNKIQMKVKIKNIYALLDCKFASNQSIAVWSKPDIHGRPRIKQPEICLYNYEGEVINNDLGLTSKDFIADEVCSLDKSRNLKVEGGALSILSNGNKIVTIVPVDENKLITYTPDGYYMTTKGGVGGIAFRVNNKVYPPEQFDLKYNRPDIVLSRLGYEDSTLITAYHLAYLKRLKKMGFTESDLGDDFEIPETKIINFEELPVITDSSEISMNLEFSDTKYNLDRINIWINDVAIYGKNGISLKDQEVNTYESNIILDLIEGLNKIQVSCYNEKGVESLKETVEITYKTIKEHKPDLYLITIGTSVYKDSRFNLQYAEKDALDIVSTYSVNKYFNRVITKTLTNDQVTLDNVKGLKVFLKDATINDQVIIFVAGHGVLDNNLDYYIASHNMDFSNPSIRGIAYEELEVLLDGIKPLKKILLIDACHSGEVDKDEMEIAQTEKVESGDVVFRNAGAGVITKQSNLGLQNTSALAKELFTDLRRGTGATIVSSAGGGEYAFEGDQWNNGLFTYCFIHGIKSKEADLNKDGDIMLSELQQYVQNQVSILSNGKQQPTSRIENLVMDFRVW